MGLNDTPSSERTHIGFFGCRNTGKSSLVNAVTGQDISVVSDVKGTTTDPVKKAMEILPLGPVVIIDTPGYDDSGALGEKRVVATKKILRNCDIAVLVTEAGRELNETEKELTGLFRDRSIPFLIVRNKSDIFGASDASADNIIYTSALKKSGIEELKNAIGNCLNGSGKPAAYLGDMVNAGDIVVLVTPIDSAAPKGRMILPQQMAIREIVEFNGTAVVTRETGMEDTLKALSRAPDLVITDSQVFKQVSRIVPAEIPLTSFSILMARYKGFLKTAVEGVHAVKDLKDGSRVLISEGCTHHRQCEDIGTVKIPKWLREFTGADLEFEWSSGGGFTENPEKYDIIIHCGGCMLNESEMRYRMRIARDRGVPFTNYGTVIAYMQGILERCLAPMPDVEY